MCDHTQSFDMIPYAGSVLRLVTHTQAYAPNACITCRAETCSRIKVRIGSSEPISLMPNDVVVTPDAAHSQGGGDDCDVDELLDEIVAAIRPQAKEAYLTAAQSIFSSGAQRRQKRDALQQNFIGLYHQLCALRKGKPFAGRMMLAAAWSMFCIGAQQRRRRDALHQSRCSVYLQPNAMQKQKAVLFVSAC